MYNNRIAVVIFQIKNILNKEGVIEMIQFSTIPRNSFILFIMNRKNICLKSFNILFFLIFILLKKSQYFNLYSVFSDIFREGGLFCIIIDY